MSMQKAITTHILKRVIQKYKRLTEQNEQTMTTALTIIL